MGYDLQNYLKLWIRDQVTSLFISALTVVLSLIGAIDYPREVNRTTQKEWGLCYNLILCYVPKAFVSHTGFIKMNITHLED